MNPILKKLGLKNQNPVLIINSPEEFQPAIKEIQSEVHSSIKTGYSFIQLFLANIVDFNQFFESAIMALEGDGHLWLCYPKGGSKKYKSDLNRDRLREMVRPSGFEAVTLVSIDDNWSALRVRRIEFIKK